MKHIILFSQIYHHGSVRSIASASEIKNLYEEGRANKDLDKLRKALRLEREANEKNLFVKPNFMGSIISSIREINKEIDNKHSLKMNP